jgi:two-component system KDP operon response regulator KdpE
MHQPKILVIDDDMRILRLLELNMQSEGYHIITATTGRSGYEVLLAEQPDAIILDLILPDMNGFAFCEQVREFSDIPIIILTAHKEEKYLVQGLDAGADDYIAKPFRLEEMFARLRAVLRRAGFSNSEECDEKVVRGRFTLHCRERSLLLDGRTIKLSRTEFKLLYFLMTHANRLMANDELISRVWGPEFVGDTEGLRTYIRYLRLKIEDEPAKPVHILTDHGIGYRFIE